MDGITFDVGKGRYLVFGANGAGKTNGHAHAVRISLPTSGRAQVAGFDLTRNRKRSKEHWLHEPEIFVVMRTYHSGKQQVLWGHLRADQPADQRQDAIYAGAPTPGRESGHVGTGPGLEAKLFVLDIPTIRKLCFGRTDRRCTRYAKGVLDDDLRGRP